MLAFLCTISIITLYVLTIFWGRFWNPLLDEPEAPVAKWPDVAVIVPARNEADILPETLPSLLAQDYPGKFRIFLIDDHSEDGTSRVAKRLAEEAGAENKLQIVTAPDLPEGWSGKVAAMQAGVAATDAPYILFTDADIEHEGGDLRQLVAKAERHGYDLTSLMVKLNCVSLAEKLFIPAFVFFFAMLYPFRLVANSTSKIAGAAGGVMLVRRAALEKSGGLAAMKGALIDDCALAKNIKNSGGKLFLALTESVKSVRRYDSFSEIHDMIARSAFEQLRYSLPFLAVAVFGLFAVFLAPVFAVFTFDNDLLFLGGIAWFVMAAIYAPMVAFYDLPIVWSLTLPIAAIFYMVATINSARRVLAGRGGLWKGRTKNHDDA